MKNFFFLAIGLVIIVGSVILFLQQPIDDEKITKTIKINDVHIEVLIADTPGTRAQGLSGKKNLAGGTGMFFIFENPSNYGFWMKDMNFAIDIVWIDEALRIIAIERAVTPETFPQVFYPNQAVKYVLELPAGFTQKNGIDIGQVVYLDS